jgi:hypothetical protein
MALPDGCPDASFPEVAVPVQLQSDALLLATAGSDASDAVPRDAAAVALPEVRLHLDAGAGRLADRVRDVPEPGVPASSDVARPAFHPSARPVSAAGPCTRAVGRFAERSCAAVVLAASAEQPGASQ